MPISRSPARASFIIVEVARLEDVERQLGPRQQQRARQRKDRQALRQVGGGPVAVEKAHAGSPQENRNGGQLAAAGEGELVLRPPGLEELHQLLARGLLVPVALLADDVEQLVGGLGAFARAVEQHGEVEPRLEIVGVLLDLPP